jgi:orotate phosphoribosyltransferase
VVVIEDVLTTGRSTRETMQVASGAGGTVIAVGSIVDRSGGQANLGVPFVTLFDIALPTYEPGACPLCRQGSSAIKPGSRGNS